MPTIAYQITPRSAFHFGREGLEQHASAETFSSDSFFSALISTAARIDPDSIEGILEAFPPYTTTPAFRLSSLFPMVGELPLFPKPRLKIETDKTEEKDEQRGKDLKQIQYVSASILERLLKSENMKQFLSGDLGRYLQAGAIWITRDEQKQLPNDWQKLDKDMLKAKKVWDVALIPRVSIDRLSNESNIYHIGRTFFSQGCGLWFMADMQDEDVRTWFENILAYLQDDGIGGERSAGYGAFTYSEIPLPIPPSVDSQHVMLLSRYSPTPQEINDKVLDDEKTAYELVDVGGYIATFGAPARKRQRVRFIEAGSIVRGNITGQLVDVSPSQFEPHRVYRSGIALTIPTGEKR